MPAEPRPKILEMSPSTALPNWNGLAGCGTIPERRREGIYELKGLMGGYPAGRGYSGPNQKALGVLIGGGDLAKESYKNSTTLLVKGRSTGNGKIVPADCFFLPGSRWEKKMGGHLTGTLVSSFKFALPTFGNGPERGMCFLFGLRCFL